MYINCQSRQCHVADTDKFGGFNRRSEAAPVDMKILITFSHPSMTRLLDSAKDGINIHKDIIVYIQS